MLPTLDSVPVHDEESALEMLEGERELLEDVIELFKESMPERLEEYAKGEAAGDREAISRAAHAIKGSAANISAMRLCKIAGFIETQARNGESEDFAAGLASLREEYARFENEVDFQA